MRTIESAVGAEIILDGKRYISFAGSSYLGLAANSEILEAGARTLRECGSGVPLARDQGIATRAHQAVEAQAAEFFGTQAALYQASGYFFGLAALAALRDEFDAVFFDESVHYSLRDAIATTGLRAHSYQHVNVSDLETQLKIHLPASGRPLIVTDGMFAALGEIAPLDGLWKAISPYAGRLLVDESHSFGVLGAGGRGASEHHGLARASVLIGGSLGKAFGTYGGIIAATAAEVAACRATAAGRGASAGLPAAAVMCARSLEHVRRHPELLQRLRTNIAYMKSGMRALGLDVGDSIAPVATFSTGTRESMRHLQGALLTAGILVYHTDYVGTGASGVIRCGIFADHTHDHIDSLLTTLRRLL